MEAATIQFLPVCSKCKQVVWDTVDCRFPTPEEVTIKTGDFGGDKIKVMESAEIYPYQCKICGAVFRNISIPTKLPFPTERYKEIDYERRSKSNT